MRGTSCSALELRLKTDRDALFPSEPVKTTVWSAHLHFSCFVFTPHLYITSPLCTFITACPVAVLRLGYLFFLLLLFYGQVLSVGICATWRPLDFLLCTMNSPYATGRNQQHEAQILKKKKT
jgi:hypothetical protein